MLHFVIFNKEQICIQNVKNKFWAEVDYIEDYERILNFVKMKSFEIKFLFTNV